MGVISLLPDASIVKNTMTLYTLFIVLIAMMIAFPLFYTSNGLFPFLSKLGHLKQPLYVYAVGKITFFTYWSYFFIILFLFTILFSLLYVFFLLWRILSNAAERDDGLE